MKVDTSSVHVSATSEFSDMPLGWSDTEGNRYHIWFDRKTRTRRDDTIYKNPSLGVVHKGPGYFRTRHLNLNAKGNTEAYTLALQIANDNKLFDQAEAESQAKREQELQQNREHIRRQKIEKLGPALLTALKAMITVVETVNSTHPDELWLGSEYQQARAVVAEAEAE